MVSIRQLFSFVASAALLVAAGPAPSPAADQPEPRAGGLEPIPANDPRGEYFVEDSNFDVRSITDADDPRLQRRNGELYCGAFATADYFNGQTLVHNLSGSAKHTIAAHGCLRVSCMNTSGIYVCNDRSTALTLKSSDIQAHMTTILQRCCIHNILGYLDDQRQSGGQQFTDALGGGWNVILAYANCGHSVTTKPDVYNGGRVNGWGCQKAAMYIS